MSFYLTSNPVNFSRQNEAAYTSQHIQFLRSGFQQPFASTGAYLNIDGLNHAYTANELLSRYIVRTNNNGGIDTLPSALDIITAIQSQQDVRALAQDDSVVVPRRGFYWDVCFSAPSTEDFYQYIVIPMTGPSEAEGIVTISNCFNGEGYFTYPLFFVQGGNYYGEGSWNPNGTLIWVRFTLVNLDPEVGPLEVNASVLTNNCYLNPPPELTGLRQQASFFEQQKAIAQQKKQAAKQRKAMLTA